MKQINGKLHSHFIMKYKTKLINSGNFLYLNSLKKKINDTIVYSFLISIYLNNNNHQCRFPQQQKGSFFVFLRIETLLKAKYHFCSRLDSKKRSGFLFTKFLNNQFLT